VRDVLLNAANAAERSHLQQRCDEIAGSDSARRDAFARYINPGLVEMYLLTGLDLNPRRAAGACLTLGTEGDSANERIIFDCVTGGGAVARGHNPADLLPEVLACHEVQHDYWAELSAELATFTLQHAFPAVSGATAVDIGISLACLANPLRRKIVVFNRNYAGKTLISLIATRCDECNAPFGPLYRQRVDIDPWSAQAEDELTAVLTSGEVALVWFEFIQGDTRRQIPATLIEIINRHKAAHGYFIGVDEILMGFYRSGPLLSHLGSVHAPDIITLAKPLSDGVFPIAATLVSDALYQQAHATQPATVAFLATLYRNQLGAHVALHAVRKIRAADFQANLNRTSAILAQGLPQLVPQLPLLKEISGQGMIYHLAYRPLCPARPEWDAFLVFFMCRFFLEHAGVILFFDGFTPPLNLKPDEAEAILQRMSNAIATHGGEIGARFQAYLCEVFGYSKDDQDIHAQLAEAMRVIEGRP
jgi:acetylornithine/succinyldiaminopimelate/putrescine aminotransferase